MVQVVVTLQSLWYGKKKKSERTIGLEYTNTNDVPITVIAGLYHPSPTNQALLKIGGKAFGYSGNQAGASGTLTPDIVTFTVPAGSTYRIDDTAGSATVIQDWHEDKMPVAVGTGGGTTDILPVLYSGMIKSDGTVIRGTGFTSTKLEGDAGQYQITFDTPREDLEYSISAIVNTGSSRFPVVRAFSETGFQINLLEVNGTPAGKVTDGNFQFIVTGNDPISVGGSGSGDSIWTDVDGDAVLETDGKQLTIDANVAELGTKARITTDTGTLELKAGTGGIPDVTISDAGLSTITDMYVNGVRVGMGGGAYAIESNTVVGKGALGANVTGTNNLGVGFNSLGKNTGGNQNTSVGSYAMHENTSGSGNTVLGNSAFYRNTEGSDNTALGNNALPFNTTGTLNTAVGANTLKANVAGGDNTALGNNALSLNEGSRNTALGYNALTNVTDANNSVAVGCGAFSSLETGIDNIGIGKSSASTLTSGNNNVVIGTSAQPSSATVSNEVTIGNGDIGKVRFGNGLGAITLNRGTPNSMGFKIDDSGAEPIFMTANKFYAPAVWSEEGASAPNVVIGPDGQMFKSTTAFYSTEEVDKKLAIKDKLIEKLSARLDELEKRVK